MNSLIIISLVMLIIVIALLFMLLINQGKNKRDSITEEQLLYLLERNNSTLISQMEKNNREMMDRLEEANSRLSNNLQGTIKTMAEMMESSQKNMGDTQDRRLAELSHKFGTFSVENEQKLEFIRSTMEKRITALQEDNGRHLDEMRNTVDEKLQKTLEDRISKSFQVVSERLEQVYKGLGEMQNLASGVGDLKKVLSNVKTRGILGEIQLGAILEQILSPDQYEENICTKSTGSERVEYAVKLPGENDNYVYLPIDAKFPGDAYAHLMDAYEDGNPEEITRTGKNLEDVIKKSAKDIHEKYVEPPATTDFAIMFLPFEGLYAEVVRRGLVEKLQKDYKINVAGPTTMAALLNSLQMGFKTLAIQKHSSEVWDTLAAVKTEFGKFENVLAKTKQRMDQANDELERLVGTRTRVMHSKLKNVGTLSSEESQSRLGLPNLEEED